MRAFQLALTLADTNYNLRTLIEALLVASVAKTVFSGSGLNDVTISAPGTKTRAFVVTVSTTGVPDKFNLDVDGSRVLTNQNMAATVSYDGTTIAFATTTGHTLGASWAFDIQGSPIVPMQVRELILQAEPTNGAGVKILIGDSKLSASVYGLVLTTGDVPVALRSSKNDFYIGDYFARSAGVGKNLNVLINWN